MYIYREREIGAVTLIIDHCSHGYMLMALKCIQHTVKESLLLLRDLSEP